MQKLTLILVRTFLLFKDTPAALMHQRPKAGYLLVRWQAGEAACCRQLWVAQKSPSVAQSGAQRHGSGPRSVVKSPQAAGTGHWATTKRCRPGWEGTGTGTPGGRPQPQNKTEHFSAGKRLQGAVQQYNDSRPASDISSS